MKKEKYIIVGIAVFLLLILLGTIIYFYPMALNLAKIDQATSEVKSLNTAIGVYISDCKTVPTGINALYVNPGVTGWQGPYIKGGTVPLNDSWGIPYRYRIISGKAVVDSSGPDQLFGTIDDIK